VIGLLQHLEVPQVDVFGFSVGGAVGCTWPSGTRRWCGSWSCPRSPSTRTETERRTPTRWPNDRRHDCRHPDGGRVPGQVAAPDGLQGLLDKLGGYDRGFGGWSDDDIRGIAAPTLMTVGDCDAVKLEHAVRFLQLRGWRPQRRLRRRTGVAAGGLSRTTHFFGLARTNLVTDVVTTFLDAPLRRAERASAAAFGQQPPGISRSVRCWYSAYGG
jgi:pimeloyl-ACP methyl ester carboxylesterase